MSCAAGVRAEDRPGVSPWSLADAWGEPGSLGIALDDHSGVAVPWGFLGLRAGAFAVRDGLPSADRPAFGLRESAAPMAWVDTVTWTIGEAAAWRGWDAPLVMAEGFALAPAPGAAQARVTAASGGTGIGRAAIDLARSTSRTVLRFGATSMARDGFERYGLEGDHVWFTSAETRSGAHTWSAAFAQRGLGNQLAPDGDPLGEGGRGESGRLGWQWQDSVRWTRLRLERSWDERHSLFLADRSFDSRRDAQSTGLDAEVGTRLGADTFDARFEARRERVRRSEVDQAPIVAVDDRAEWWWSALGWRRPVAGGRLDAQFGGGWHSALRVAEHATQWAPGVSWTRESPRWPVRLFAERLLAPVWHDRAPGSPAFLQDAWVLGGEGARIFGDRGAFRAGLLRGSVDDRAIQVRYPIQDIVLRTGTVADAEPYQFVLAHAGLTTGRGWLAAEATGWAAAVRGSSPRLEPESGARASLLAHGHLFQGDLGVRLRAGGAWVGAHDLQPIVDTGGRAPGYATAFAQAELTLADVTFTLRASNLENARRPEQWADPATLERAHGAGRTIMSELTWRFSN